MGHQGHEAVILCQWSRRRPRIVGKGAADKKVRGDNKRKGGNGVVERAVVEWWHHLRTVQITLLVRKRNEGSHAIRAFLLPVSDKTV